MIIVLSQSVYVDGSNPWTVSYFVLFLLIDDLIIYIYIYEKIGVVDNNSVLVRAKLHGLLLCFRPQSQARHLVLQTSYPLRCCHPAFPSLYNPLNNPHISPHTHLSPRIIRFTI